MKGDCSEEKDERKDDSNEADAKVEVVELNPMWGRLRVYTPGP